MEKIPEECAAAFKEMDLLDIKRREDADKSLISELYKTMLECGGIRGYWLGHGVVEKDWRIAVDAEK